ncbi:SURF1 family protein [Pseudoalteromonas mariniglutinosa]|uniref:SURF1 family protein n=1 Tax=Pseudoalteromonas mariniglutinosa TaxID=206042 RepID=UPI00384EFBE9
MQLILWRKQKLSAIITVCIVAMAVMLCLRLSYWQLQRGEQKLQQLNELETRQQQGYLSWKDIEKLPAETNKTGLLLAVTGKVISAHYWLLDNQILNGQVGYDLLAAVQLTDSQAIVLVNFGWLKAPIKRTELPEVNWPSQPIDLKLQLKEGDLQGYTLAMNAGAESGWPKRIQTIDLAIFSEQLKKPLHPFIGYRKNTTDVPAIPHYEAVVMGPDKHYAYAVQWLLIGLACVVIAYFAMRKRSTDEN